MNFCIWSITWRWPPQACEGGSQFTGILLAPVLRRARFRGSCRIAFRHPLGPCTWSKESKTEFWSDTLLDKSCDQCFWSNLKSLLRYERWSVKSRACKFGNVEKTPLSHSQLAATYRCKKCLWLGRTISGVFTMERIILAQSNKHTCPHPENQTTDPRGKGVAFVINIEIRLHHLNLPYVYNVYTFMYIYINISIVRQA